MKELESIEKGKRAPAKFESKASGDYNNHADTDDDDDTEMPANAGEMSVHLFRAVVESEREHSADGVVTDALRRKFDAARSKYGVGETKARSVIESLFGAETDTGHPVVPRTRARSASSCAPVRKKTPTCRRCTYHEDKTIRGAGEVCGLCRKTELVRSRYLSLLKVSFALGTYG